MYPQSHLIRLRAYKATLQRDIAVGRVQCSAAAVRLGQPLQWLDRIRAASRQLAPLAAIPLVLLLRRTLLPRWKIFDALVRWGPVVAGAVQSLRATDAAVKTR